MKHEGDQGKPRRQTKLLQNNGKESLKGGQGYSMIVVWCGVVWHHVVRGVLWRGEVKGE